MLRPGKPFRPKLEVANKLREARGVAVVGFKDALNLNVRERVLKSSCTRLAPYSDVRLVEFASGHEEEGHTRFSGNRTREQSLSCSAGASEENTLR
jgi:hypothetical protein